MKTEVVIFGGGCFWCTEAIFKMIEGVISVIPGYAGGDEPNPKYEQVCGGKTGHAECTYIEYDPSIVNFKTLLTVFFGSHDPTTLNRQGNDVGTQYRSIIFYSTPEQKRMAENMIKEINNSSENGKPVVTEVAPMDVFYEAENYHKDYYKNNKNNPYCEIVINPKLEKIKKEFGKILKEVYKKE